MSELTIDDELRAALLKAHSYKCPYTNEMLNANNFEIDHVIPQSLKKNPKELKELLKSLGLPSDFNLNSLDNLLPCHPSSNRKKSNNIFQLGNLRFFLDLASRLKPKVEKNLDAIRKSNVLAKAENLLKISLARGQLDSESLQNLIEKLSNNIINNHPNESNIPSNSFLLNGDLELSLDTLSVSNKEISNINESSSDIETDANANANANANAASNTKIKVYPSPLSDSAEKKIRNEKIIYGIKDFGLFHLYSDRKNNIAYLDGPGTTRIIINDRRIDFIFKSEDYFSPSFPSLNFNHITSLHLSIKPLFDIIISLMQNDQTLESFSLLYDFSIKDPAPINFGFKCTSKNRNPDLHGLTLSGSYFIKDYDIILDDEGRRLLPSLNSSYIEVLVLLYDIYWFISREKYEKD